MEQGIQLWGLGVMEMQRAHCIVYMNEKHKIRTQLPGFVPSNALQHLSTPINSHLTWGLAFHLSWFYYLSLCHWVNLSLGDHQPILPSDRTSRISSSLTQGSLPGQLYCFTRCSRCPSAWSLRMTTASGKVPFMHLLLFDYILRITGTSVDLWVYIPSAHPVWVYF